MKTLLSQLEIKQAYKIIKECNDLLVEKGEPLDLWFSVCYDENAGYNIKVAQNGEFPDRSAFYLPLYTEPKLVAEMMFQYFTTP